MAAAACALLLSGCSAGGAAPARSSPSAGAAAASGHPTPKPTPPWNPHPASIAALGDSITRGFDACSVLSDCPEVSWVTGTYAQVSSFAGRALGVPEGRTWNLATTGARMSDLPRQAESAAGRKPEMVTVLMGANDACRDSVADMTPVADFRADFGRAMETLHRELPTTQVFVASIPDLKRLWTVGRQNPMGPQIWKLGICPSMLHEADSLSAAAQARRDTVQARVVAYNAALREVCARYERCRYDGGAVFDYRFTEAELSQWDWFHPSVAGQAQLARILYEAAFR